MALAIQLRGEAALLPPHLMSASPIFERSSRSPDDIIKRFLDYIPPQQTPRPDSYRADRRARSHSPKPSVSPVDRQMPVHRRIRSHNVTASSPISRPIEPTQEFLDDEGNAIEARRPSGPKAKFTPEDDALLVELKEKHDLTWKKISDFFPGRSSGTLQVRYCTKLKAKGVTWTAESVQRLQSAMQEYDSEKWRIISAKVGQGFSALACKEKAETMAITNKQSYSATESQLPYAAVASASEASKAEGQQP